MTSSPFEKLELVDVNGRFGPIQGNDDGEPYRDLRGGDRQGKKHEDLSVDVVKILRECDEVDVRRVQHEFHRQQNDDDVASDQHADKSGQKYDGAEGQIVGQGNHGCDVASAPRSFLASTIAPIMATRRSNDATSNGNR